ncbi:DUF6506 family protein [Ruania zhangjianzhongii]|uniref:DUF6506 family protein n=1 Tax=Ruania zhangjianzhongii TaxID=2603206 RepID=UPI0011C88CBC|nr:DUF6506 family protein [Ruania zhangjianzhongii]
MTHTTAIYEGTPGRRLRTDQLDVTGIADDGLEQALQQALDGGTGRIELCGGMGAAQAAQALAVVAGRVPVGLLRYAFESLELISDYKQAFASGNPPPAVFLYPTPAPGTAGTEAVEHPDVTILPVDGIDHAEQLGAQFARDGVGMVELYGGLGTATAAAVLRGADGGVPVGFVNP